MSGPFNSKSKVNEPDQLITPNFPYVEEGGTILTGLDLKRGTVLGKITASGKLVAVDSANSDGSENPYGVLMEDAKTDAPAGDKVAPVATSGQFIVESLIFGGSDTIADHKDAMRDINLLTKELAEENP